MNRSITVTLIILSLAPTRGAWADDLYVPFKLKRNVVTIPTRISGSAPLDLILDTGMGFDGVYLFKSAALSGMDTSGIVEVRVPGAGAGEPSKALMIEHGALECGDVSMNNQRVIVSLSDLTQNFPSDGVVGWSLLGHYTVEIDYDAEKITLHDQDFTAPDSSWREIPITLQNNIPFLEGTVEVVEGETTAVSLYIDLASDKPLELLTRPDQKYTLPHSLIPSYLGTGLSGDIHGSIGMSCHLWLGGFALAGVSTAFAPSEVRSKQAGADGIIGNDCLRRFNIIFDYSHSRIYLKPNASFSTAFAPLAPAAN